MVLDLPRVVVAQAVGELDLGERLLEEVVLAPRRPRARQLVLVEDAELHASVLLGSGSFFYFCTQSVSVRSVFGCFHCFTMFAPVRSVFGSFHCSTIFARLAFGSPRPTNVWRSTRAVPPHW